MSAITGRWFPPNKQIGKWGVDWLHVSLPTTDLRHQLADQLDYISRVYGSHEAIEFRNYLLWAGSVSQQDSFSSLRRKDRINDQRSSYQCQINGSIEGWGMGAFS